MATIKLTKAQLVARIDELEREVAALHIAQRPSRSAALSPAVTQGTSPIVYLSGKPYTYSIAIEGGRRVKTYHPVCPG